MTLKLSLAFATDDELLESVDELLRSDILVLEEMLEHKEHVKYDSQKQRVLLVALVSSQRASRSSDHFAIAQ